jgi:endonuclease/exonuclease/phosphatase family metal-dependent hydrolase
MRVIPVDPLQFSAECEIMYANAKLKRFGVGFLICLGVCLGWYAQSRILAPYRCVRVVDISTETSPAGNSSTLQLAAYNIAHGRGGEHGASNWTGASEQQIDDHLARIAEQAEEVGIDILVLNEVDFQSSWSRYINQARSVASQAGFRYVAEQRNVDVSMPFRKYCFGNAILSKYPIKDIRVIRFPPLSRKEAVFAGNHDGLLAHVATPLGDLRVLAVHLEYRSEDVRVECARIVKTLVMEDAIPIVVMGDFNSSPIFAKGHQTSKSNHNAVDFLLNSGLTTTRKTDMNWVKYVTFPSANPVRAIDWILCSPDIEQGYPSVVQSRLSDHLMVTETITFSTKGSPPLH